MTVEKVPTIRWGLFLPQAEGWVPKGGVYGDTKIVILGGYKEVVTTSAHSE